MLLDTHAMLWALCADSRMSAAALRHFETEPQLAYSVVSLWEIGIKLGLGRDDFKLASTWWRDIPRALAANGISCLQVEPQDCRDVAELPLHHRDPFDRMLVVQAIRQHIPILSVDEKLDAYAIERIW